MVRKRQHEPQDGEVVVPRFEFIPDPERVGAFVLRMGVTDQSYVDPGDPLHLEFDYVARFAEALAAWRPPPERIRILHLGGGGLTLPRFVSVTRPTSAQVVCEPDAELTAAVREHVPLPPRSGIKVRAQGGREGVAACADDSFDAVVLDAFAGGSVPAELTTLEFLADVARVLAPGGLFAANIADQAPFDWSRRAVAGVLSRFPDAAAGALTGTWRGRRYGNIVVLGGERLNVAHLARRAAGAAFPYRWQARPELERWIAGARPFTDADARPSMPPQGLTTLWF